jgi:hypothetical protein
LNQQDFHNFSSDGKDLGAPARLADVSLDYGTPLLAKSTRDYAAALATAIQKWFWGPLYLRRIPRLILFTKVYLLFGGMITQSPGK